jgi:hypothetical protein
MTKSLRLFIAVIAILAPALHLASDVMEWAAGGGFSTAMLLVNYLGFLMMPFMIIGLYAVQRPQIDRRLGWVGLLGALLYGISFIYFSHTTLLSIEESVPNYEALWGKLGMVYTFHGGLMVAGGLLFGFASFKAGVLWRSAIIAFVIGILLNLLLSFLPLPEILQTAGSTLRNLGLIGMGVGLVMTPLQNEPVK